MADRQTYNHFFCSSSKPLEHIGNEFVTAQSFTYPISFAAHAFTLESHCTRTVQSIAGRLQSMRAHTILLWFTVILSMSYCFTVINFHDDVFSCNNPLAKFENVFCCKL